MKKLLKLLLVTLVYSVLFMITNGIIPISQALKEASAANADSMSAVYLFVYGLFISLTICYLAANSSWRGAKRIIGITVAVFLVASFMTQIETWFFIKDFPLLTVTDIVMFTIAPLPSIIASVLMGVKFFGSNEPVPGEAAKIEFRELIPRIAVIGIIYMAVYFIFGYFVAWQFEALRIFYSGASEKAGFIGQLANNVNNNPIIYPFQILRGIMFAVFVLPVIYMLREKGRIKIITGICLLYLCTAIVLILPNVLFPDAVRCAHFIEMLSSMLVFGVIAGLALYR